MRRSSSSLGVLCAAFLLAVGPSPAQESAEAKSLFRKLADRVTGAKSVAIVLSGTSFEASVHVSILMKQGNKMRMEVAVEGFRDGKPSMLPFRPVAPPVEHSLYTQDQMAGREALPVEFRVKSDLDFAEEISAILRLDPATGLPVQRLNAIGTDGSLTVMENDQKFVLNEPVNDTSFVLPQE